MDLPALIFRLNNTTIKEEIKAPEKADNDSCIWVVVGTSEYVRERNPITVFDIRLVKGSYVCWEKNEIINEGEVINRTNRALKKVMVKIEEA